MRIVVAACTVDYAGRLAASLPEAKRLLVVKADGSVLVHADSGGYKPLNWMSGPCVLIDGGDVWEVTNAKGERLTITFTGEVVLDSAVELGAEPGLAKDGVEAHLQELLAAHPAEVEPGLVLVRREHATAVGPVDLLCRDGDGCWVAVEIKRIVTIEAVEQLSRYLERIDGECRGILAGQIVKPQARTLAEARGIRCVEVDLAVLRGEREPELTLFA